MTKFLPYMALFIGPGVFGGPRAETYFDDSAGTASFAAEEDADRQVESTVEFWTKERMEGAQPAPMPTSSQIVPDGQFGVEAEPAPITEPPGVAPGWSPESDEPPPPPDAYYELDADTIRALRAFDASPQTFGAPPSNPRDGPYGPFQRWSMQGKYRIWPRSIHGKLFFSSSSGSFVCSATVINRSTIATAGHCVADGQGNWYTNFLFCPSYLQTGQNPEVGCWAWSSVATSSNWLNTGDVDYDYACIVTDTSGTLINDKIGNLTGWAGRAWNWSAYQPIQQFGYPAAAPFDGTVIQQVAATEWYEVDMTPGGQKSKYIGSDLTGGSSGGGWFLSWRHPDTEFPDTDNNLSTDPAGAQNGPMINGVNSHSRCQVDCADPPTASNGSFWQEMGSPPFLSSSAGGESEDVFAMCLSHANNN